MDFNKVAQEILELQKKIEKEPDELSKLYLQLNMYFNKQMISNIENIYKEV